ncbi:hypothetical protein Dsin_030307 [Dipteronia sinensis]|uniref:RNase H type-1 domain-containing protein n=1 Tax=Dipteronia sinensis TaxID=43782 RepID=A0AAD9ZIK9_9ROSI|nr:hypothetical protein Dsin_030307 [Dipteronia sinensis]
MERVLECVQPCLAPKKSSFLDAKFTPDEIKRAIFDMSPTKLMHIIYNVVAKSLANRFCVALNNEISETRSAFIPSRLISNNAIVGFECMHALKRRKQKEGRKGVMVINLDFSKPMIVLTGNLSQGDPLSPYLFLICAEGLSRLMFKVEGGKDLAGFQCSRWGAKITRLFFADDSMIFRKVLEKDCLSIKNILDCYADASGSPSEGSGAINSHVLHIPFRLPKALINDLRKLSARFWCGLDEERRKIHWVGWCQFCQSKDNIRLWFLELAIFNQALLAKQVWRIHHNPNTLAARVLKHCHFADSSILMGEAGSSSSFVWKSFVWGKELLEKGSRWKVGSGDSILIYHDRWILRPLTFKVYYPPVLRDMALVNDLKLLFGLWNEALKASKDCLPVMSNLAKRGMQVDRWCPFCVNVNDIVPWANDFLEDFKRVTANVEVETGLWPCIVESDSQIVVSLIKSSNVRLSDICLIIGDILDLVNGQLQCKVCFIPRKANMVAYCFVKLGVSLEIDRFWMEEVPSSVPPIVLGETSVLL